MKIKLTSIPLWIAFIILFNHPIKACEPPGPPISWYLVQFTDDPIALPEGIEIKSIDYWGDGGKFLTITNNTDKAVYVIENQVKADELRTLYEESLENSEPTNWVTQVAALSNSEIDISPAETQFIAHKTDDMLRKNFPDWPEDYGGRRPDNVILPEPIKSSILLVHQNGIETISFTGAIVANPAYPDTSIWNGCGEVDGVVILPTPISSEDTAIASNSTSINPFWFIVGFGILVIIVLGVFISHRSEE